MSKETDATSPEVFRKKQGAIWVGSGICVFSLSYLCYFLVAGCFCFAVYLITGAVGRHFFRDYIVEDRLFGLAFIVVAALLFLWHGYRKMRSGFVYRLTFRGDEVEVQGIKRVWRFRFDEVTSLEWRKGGMPLVVHFRDETLKLREYEYSSEDFNKICERFKIGVPKDLHNY